MFRLLLLMLAFYIIFKAVKLFIQFFIPAVKGNEQFNPTSPSRQEEKREYRDVQEVEFTEIKSENKDGKE